MLADIQRTVYSEEVTRQLHVMAQVRESSPVTDRRSNHSATPPTKFSLASFLNNIAYYCYREKASGRTDRLHNNEFDSLKLPVDQEYTVRSPDLSSGFTIVMKQLGYIILCIMSAV